MLSYLSIKNYALIDSLELDFESGMTALTGETGAGKSILLGALSLLLGARADMEAFRDQSRPIVVEATFVIAKERSVKNAIARVFEIYEDDDELIIRREVSASGKNKCIVNGHLVQVNVLKSIGAYLVDIHGQHDHQLLFDQSQHSRFLDALGGLEEEIVRYRGHFADYRKMRAELEECSTAEANKMRELDMLNFQIAEIEEAKLSDDAEEDELRRKKHYSENAGKVRAHIDRAYDVLFNGEHCAGDALHEAVHELKALALFDEKASQLIELLEQAQAAVDDVVLQLQRRADATDCDPADLDRIGDRLALIASLKKKYGQDVASIRRYVAQSKERRDLLTNNEERIRELTAEVAKVERFLTAEAQKISRQRKKVAAELKKNVECELAALSMQSTTFDVSFELVAIGEDGCDRIEFMIATNVGEPVKPLARIASGGEAARIMLALKRILARVDQVGTLIFDEIDANIGGRIGKIVGQKIREIGKERQVLLVTHLPQIAAMAETHIKVNKHQREGRMVTQCSVLDENGRVAEIAQMMSGQEATKISHEHAREMMKQ